MSSARQERQIEQILEGFGDGFCAFDRDWRITYCHRAAEAHAGIARGEGLGRVEIGRPATLTYASDGLVCTLTAPAAET